ncbi:aldehyde dehydrogenase family protein, partial [Serratia marcescens]|uniref:aldehyde dehydrogenase family protein n=1 Tax=Serratia marcescens TaxID=615 RepID=UPI003362F8DE
KQWQRVQDYIRLGEEEGATLLVGGVGRPSGMDKGWCVKPTVLTVYRHLEEIPSVQA